MDPMYYRADPDMSCFGKAMANGYPISAITGNRILERSGRRCLLYRHPFFQCGAYGRFPGLYEDY